LTTSTVQPMLAILAEEGRMLRGLQKSLADKLNL
jgi:hypothetical protein